jgi:hypothetical protein
MSRINKLQAAALKMPVEKVTPASAPVNTLAKKAVAAKPAVSKSPSTATAKPVARPTVAKATTTKPVKAKEAKPVKAPKLKMERDSFTMPKAEYAQIYVLKERLTKLGHHAKKSELLRAGIMQLTAMTDAALKAAMSKVPTIKTGRPKKK